MARRHESVDWISDCLTCANGPKIKKCPRPGSAPSDERGAMRQTEGTPTRTHPILPIARRMDGMMERERTSERAASPSASSLRSLQGSKVWSTRIPLQHCRSSVEAARRGPNGGYFSFRLSWDGILLATLCRTTAYLLARRPCPRRLGSVVSPVSDHLFAISQPGDECLCLLVKNRAVYSALIKVRNLPVGESV